jgi:hypothetical protein
MSSTRALVTEMLIDSIASDLDEDLHRQGFRRSRRSLKYSREVANGEQYLLLHFDVRPRYEPDALAHLLPYSRLQFPMLDKRFAEMSGDATSEALATPTYSDQVSNCASIEAARREARRWFMRDQVTTRQCVVSLRQFAQAWIIPFLNRYRSVVDLVTGIEARDSCLTVHTRVRLMAVAALTLNNRPLQAMQYLESHFGQAGPRRDYAQVFSYVQKLLDGEAAAD